MFLIFGLVYGIIFIAPENSEAYAEEYPIMPTALPTISLTIGGSTGANLSTKVVPGDTAYVATDVAYSSADSVNYNLQLSYASGESKLAGATSISDVGTTGTAGTAMGDNTWGYTWVDTSVGADNYADQKYYSVPAYRSNSYTTSGTDLASGKLDAGTTVSTTTKQLVFAAKFGEGAATGHYQTNLLLSLLATPKSITYTINYNSNLPSGVSGVANMPTSTTYNSTDTSVNVPISTQKPTLPGYTFEGWSAQSGQAVNALSNQTIYPMSSSDGNTATPVTLYAVWRLAVPTVKGFNGATTMQDFDCSKVSAVGTTGQLYDTRDYSTYTVIKAIDGKCWMTQNLRLTRESIAQKDPFNTGGTLTTADSNVAYTIPASTNDAFSDAKSDGTHYSNEQVRAAANDYYGAYYSYNVATVNTMATKDTGTAEKKDSICPKGWRLPTGGSDGEFRTLYNIYPNKSDGSVGKVGTWSSGSMDSGYWLGAASESAGGVFFPAAGFVYTSGLVDTGTVGYYWSSTLSSATYAYRLSFASTALYPALTYYRYVGLPVRCVAG